MSQVVFQQVTKRFGDTVAVDDLDLRVDDGEFMVLLGPSGCGKTTALRLIAGLETVDAGRLHIGDRDVTRVEAKDRDVAMVFQSYALYPHMTVAGNIESPLVARKMRVDTGDARKLTAEERRTRVEEAAQVLGLSELLRRKPAALSGGQRQRVALARAIVSRPSVFLMDEPLSNLDAKLRAQTRLELVDLHRRLDTTFVYVTHDQVEAMTMASRMAVMVDGRLQQVGTAKEVYEQPVNLFVARFIGSPPMNSLPGTFEVRDGEPSVLVGTGSWPLGVGAPSVDPGRRVVVGVRPEHLTVVPAGTRGGVDGVIAAVEWLGHERHLVCDLDGSRLTVREPTGHVDPEPGRPVRLRARAVQLFDEPTGDRLR
jgi:multiple sugar transport system ATP-binding protein